MSEIDDYIDLLKQGYDVEKPDFLDKKPTLLPDDQFYLRIYNMMSTERPSAMGFRTIPYSARRMTIQHFIDEKLLPKKFRKFAGWVTDTIENNVTKYMKDIDDEKRDRA